MAIRKKESIGVIEFISSKDESINTDLNTETEEPISNIEKYKEDWKFEKHCQIKEGEKPTIFKLNFSLTPRKQILIDNSSLGGDGKKEQFGFKLGTHKFTTVKCILVGIDNPDDVPLSERFIFKKDNQGLAHDDVLAELYSTGILEEIYSFYITHKENTDELKKK
jgi:hypothetical protein